MFNDVFISYSRKDKEFVEVLHQALKEHNRNTWVDWQDIPLTSEWWKEIESGIEAADTFIFVLSPDSLASKVCGQEIGHAVKYNKRLVPIVRRDDFDDKQVHSSLSKHNWLFFRENDDFDTAFGKLITAINTDLDYVSAHTRYLVRAREWESKGRNQDSLLRGRDLAEAREWLSQGIEKEPRPTPLQTQYIAESSKAEAARQEKEIANQREKIRLQRILMFCGVGIVAAIGFLLFFFSYSRNLAIREIDALLDITESYNQLDALVASLKAGKKLKEPLNIHIKSPERQAEVITALHKSISWVNLNPSIPLEGHELTVFNVNFSPDGEIIASASEDDTIKLWKRNGILIDTLKGHSDDVARVIFSPADRQMLASASYDGTVKLWKQDGESESYKEAQTLKGHSDRVYSVSFSPDGQLLASASADKTVKLWQWDGNEFKLLKTLEGRQGHSNEVYQVTFSPDGEIIASASVDRTVKLWRHDGTLLQTLEGHNGRILQVSFSPDGQIISASSDGTIKLWRRDGKGEFYTKAQSLEEHSDKVYSVSFSPDGQLLVSASGDKTVKLWQWNGTEFKLLKTLEGQEGHRDAVYRVSFSPDGTIIASASNDKTIKLWTKDGTLLHTLEEHKEGVIGISFSDDSQTLASASYDSKVILWRLNYLNKPNNGLFRVLRHGDDKIPSVSFTKDGQMIASTNGSTVKLWKPDGSQVGKEITVFTKETRELEEKQKPPHELEVKDIDISPDGQLLASGSADGTVKLWKPDGTLVQTLKYDNGLRNDVLSVSFSPDGQLLAAAGADKTIKLWKWDGDGKSYTEAQTLKGHESRIFEVSFSPDGQLLASASADRTVKLWKRDGEGESYTEAQTLEGHRDRVLSVSFSPSGQLLASASVDGTVKLWKLHGTKFKLLKTLEGHNNSEGHNNRVLSVSFSSNDQLLASASSDGTINLWKRDGTWLMDLKGHSGNVSQVSFSPDGKILASASDDQTTILWKLPEAADHEPILDELIEGGCKLGYVYLNSNLKFNDQEHRELCSK